jgi:hypothetical protein
MLRGKRRQHPFSEVAADGTVSNKLVTIDGRELDYYDPAMYTQGYDSVSYDGQVASDAAVAQQYDQAAQRQQQQATDEWVAYLDEHQTTYYYNQYTGETTYNYPSQA